MTCRYFNRPRWSFPCNKCEDKNCNNCINAAVITCDDCRLSWYNCERRGKNQRRLQTCEYFKWG